MLQHRLLLLSALLALAISRAGECSTVTVMAGSQDGRSCIVHFQAAKGEEHAVPCSQSIDISGKTTAWVEQETRITPYRIDVTSGGTFRTSTFVSKATLRIADANDAAGGDHLRLISFVPPRDGTSLRNIFTREMPMISGPVVTPAGRTLILRLDAKGRLVRFSDVVASADGERVAAWSSDRRAAAVVASLSKENALAGSDVHLLADDANGAHPADAVVEGSDAIIALWHNVAGAVRIRAESEKVYLPDNHSVATPGDILLVEASLHRLPTLTVAIGVLPKDVRAPDLTLVLSTFANDAKVIRKRTVRPGESYALEYVPATLLSIELHVGDFVLERQADLSPGNDVRVALALEPIEVSGVVYKGVAPARGEVRFLQKGIPIIAETDDSGAYEVTLWQPRRYVVEAVAGFVGNAPAFSEDVSITSSRVLDIQIPSNAISVRIADGDNGKAVENAKVMIHNVWEGGASAMVIPANGLITALPPQRNGRTEVRVHAEGYVDTAAVMIPVDDALGEKIIDFVLTRDSDVIRLTVRFENGSPAAGAELAAWSGQEMAWHAFADQAGEVAIPRATAKLQMIVRHPDAASNVVLIGAENSTNAVTLSPAAPPLVVRVAGADGKATGPVRARITLTQRGGRRLTGQKAAFATWSLGATAPNGLFVARGLRPQPVHLFATSHATTVQIESGAFDGLATMIDYPWAAVNTITVADP